MLQLHLSDRQFYCLLRYTYIRGFTAHVDSLFIKLHGTNPDETCIKTLVKKIVFKEITYF